MILLTMLGLLLAPFILVGGGLAFFWKSRRRAVLKWSILSYIVAAILLCFGVGPYLLAWAITHSGTRMQDQVLKGTPANYEIPFEDIVFDAKDGTRLSGWFVAPTRRNVVIIYTHGLFRNRVEMLGRAMALCQSGYGALLYDSRSHGISGKGIVSLGYYERGDVLAAIQYVQQRFQDSAEQPAIVLMGVSMGAVAVLEAAAESKSYSALILDSPFASLKETIADHAWLFLGMPKILFSPLFTFWFERIAGFEAARVDSYEALQKAVTIPLLVIASEGDKRIPSQIARRLYEESKAPIKEIKVFGEDVGHGAAYRYYPDEYSEVLNRFLDRVFPALKVPQPDPAPLNKTTGTAGSPR